MSDTLSAWKQWNEWQTYLIVEGARRVAEMEAFKVKEMEEKKNKEMEAKTLKVSQLLEKNFKLEQENYSLKSTNGNYFRRLEESEKETSRLRTILRNKTMPKKKLKEKTVSQ